MYKHSQSFSDFVTEALYSPNGYYRKKVDIGTKGDFYTSPSQTPLFGRALASSFSKTIIENKILGEIKMAQLGLYFATSSFIPYHSTDVCLGKISFIKLI